MNYIASNGTATTANSDYGAASDSDGGTPGVLTIPAGQLTGTITVPVTGDLLDELNETFFVNLSAPTNATIAGTPSVSAQGVGTITDDDAAPSLSINDVSVTEGNSVTATAAFTVTLSAASGQTVSVNYATAPGTATAPGDYLAVPLTTLTFAPGETTKPVTVTVNGDTLIENNETFNVNLSGVVTQP